MAERTLPNYILQGAQEAISTWDAKANVLAVHVDEKIRNVLAAKFRPYFQDPSPEVRRSMAQLWTELTGERASEGGS